MLRFLESFDHYTDGWGDVQGKWQDGGNAFGNSGFGAGRTGSAWLNNDSDRRIFRNMETDEAVWTLGFAFLKTGVNNIIAAWYDPIAANFQASIGMDALGRLVLYRGNGATLLGTGTTILASSVWHYVEWKVEIDNAGDSEVRLNGVTEISVTGVDLQLTANAFARQLWLGPPSGGGSQGRRDYDDVYVLDADDSGVTGAPNNDFLGDVRVQCLFPSGNGNSSQLDGSDGNQVDNYLLVDETSPDDDTTYVESSDVGDKDTYAYGNLTPAVGTVYGMQIIPSAKKTDAGARSIASVVRLGTTEEDSADKPLLSSYQFLPDIREADPDGNQWTISNVNAMEAGVKVTA